ncbi:type II secretion system F family protein [Aquamicrobium defluvii]|uniref:Tight adherence protein C n=1 Tax=Aquamicrobium defluvii TaxID=69279 RepID=A0A011UWF0_9HYPH|nr:type II secretion system F family protein [Aquamicrobium defluvii]EXL10223.1 type II secretion system protein [Aquamicrobium defluvii]EZQ16999.1 type II secretion system protein [Halopseudomonas bauzanensis]TDR33752.1 tight adherence protein C [Aquamicrobium defluvii]
MSAQTIKTLTDPAFLTALLVGIAVFATMMTLLPAFGGNPLKNRMKAVALERDELRAKQRARLVAEADRRSRGLREQQSTGMRRVVERLDLRRLLADENTVRQLKTAGFRGQNPMTQFLFFRLVLPFVGLGLAAVYIFGLGVMEDKPMMIRVFACIGAAYAGFYAPIVYVTNRASKRKESIKRAWPDALDLMLICVESGMSIEAAMRKVAEEIGSQSVELAEEFVLTTAELSYLQERRQAYENLAERTGLEPVKSVTQALIQAERYGTPVAHALRVLSSESRDARMTEAEKKAAALPPKLTVPMILFFLPVLFAIILGPAGIQLSQNGGFFGDQPQSSATE